MKKILFSLMIALALLTAGTALAEGGVQVVASSFPCYDFARQTVGERGEVSLLIRPGVEVHSFEPTPSDILAIGGADLFVYVGGEGDAWADGILAGFDGDGPEALRMMDAVSLLEEEGEEEHDHEDENEGPEYDEHIWTSPRNAALMVAALADRLGEIDPENAGYYAENAADYIAEIDAIDAAFAEVVEGAARRELVVADRFPFLYFVREFGLDYLAAFPSCTADTEPTPQTIMTLIRRVVDDGVPVIYTIELSTQAVAKAVAEETGAEILTLHSLQTVAQDEFERGETYASIMWKNVEALREGLN